MELFFGDEWVDEVLGGRSPSPHLAPVLVNRPRFLRLGAPARTIIRPSSPIHAMFDCLTDCLVGDKKSAFANRSGGVYV